MFAVTYSHQFGILVPMETGIEFKHQCGGMICRQVTLEGVYLPLRPPYIFDDDEGGVNLMGELRNWNYPSADDYILDWNSLDEIWDAIADNVSFHYEELDYGKQPEGYPTKTEGIKWIRIEGPKRYQEGWKEGQSRMKHGGDWPETLEGEKVALLYPNCD